MKNLLIAGLVGLAQTQNADIITNQNQIAPPSDGGVIFNQDGENHVVEYRKDFNEDDLNVTCSANNMCIELKKSFLAQENITTNYNGLHLKNCEQGVREGFNDDSEYIRVCTEIGFNTCGTEMHMNKTHVSYLNRLFTTNGDTNMQKGSVIVGTLNEFIVPWHCVYPLEYLVGLESETGDKYGYFIPKIYDVVTVTLLLKPGEGTGEFPVAMMLYKDNTYDEVYNEAPKLNVTDRLYIQTTLLSGPSTAVIQTRECWATSTAAIDDAVSYTLIRDFCEDPAAIEQAEVDILTNGVDVNSRWEANVFKFVNKPVVHLHCKVRICFDTEDSQCSDVQNMCGNRKRRAVDGYLPAEDKEAVVSIGPLTMEGNVLVIGDEQLLERLEDEIVEEMIEESESVRLPGYFIYALLGCLVAVIGLLVAVILLSYKRRRNSKAVNLEGDH